MKNAIKQSYRGIFALLVGLAISGIELSSDSRPGFATGQDEANVSVQQTFTVTTTSDGTGAGTLRTAITAANANPGLDTINFNITGSGVQTLPITSALPVITDPVIIDGTTQSGYSGTPLIRLTPGAGGVTGLINITGGGSTVRALSFAFFSAITTNNGMIVLASNNNIVTACHSGTGSGGTQIYITGSNNTVGGATAADRNFFYGNTSSRENVIVNGATATGNRIVGNVFGTTPAGVRQTNAGKNILIDSATNNTVGGSNGTTPGGGCTGECNLISGSDNDGIMISGATATGNSVIGNFIGMATDGLNVNRNSNYGVHILNAGSNQIGGDAPEERNVIAANSFGSVFVEGTGGNNIISGNYVGLKTNGSEAVTGSFNVPAFGVQLNSNNNRVGGIVSGERNIISGSNRGIIINGASNLVQGNYIGTNAAGDAALTTQFDGVLITGSNNTIGGTAGTVRDGSCVGACNLISGNGRNTFNHGLVITGANATGNTVDGNYIGVNATATAAIPNGNPPNGRAILILNSNGNTIGREPDVPPIVPRPEENVVTPGDFCVYDQMNYDFFQYTALGGYVMVECRNGQEIRHPLAPFKRGSAPNFEYYTNLGNMFVNGASGNGTFHFPNPPELDREVRVDGPFRDLVNGGNCSCPPGGRQTFRGTMEYNGTNNTFQNNYTPANLPAPAEYGIWGSGGEGNRIQYNNLTTLDNSTVFITTGNTVVGNILSHNIGIAPIQNGETGYPVVILTNGLAGSLKVTGSLTTGVANQEYLVGFSAYSVNETGTTANEKALRTSFRVTTNAGGTVPIDLTLTGLDALSLINAGTVRTTATQVFQTPRSGTEGETLGRTSEMSPPVHVPRPVSDLDKDGKTDLVVFRPGTTATSLSYWYIFYSSDNTFRTVQFGIGEDQVLQGDFNGDRIGDLAVYRPSNNNWYNSGFTGEPSINFDSIRWGSSGDIPVKGDFAGDGFADRAIYRGGVWWIRHASTGNPIVRQFGLPSDKPVPADYNGDGRTDIAVYRNGIWYISVCETCAAQYENFGLSTDKPVPDDYDGDGNADVAVFRPADGTWYILQSSNRQVMIRQFGLSTDIPVPGDYDADGKTDIAIWRPSDGNWWLSQSSDGATRVVHWGQTGDIPIPTIP